MLLGTPVITRQEVAGARFRKTPVGKRGYLKSDVDAFLSRVVAEWPAAR